MDTADSVQADPLVLLIDGSGCRGGATPAVRSRGPCEFSHTSSCQTYQVLITKGLRHASGFELSAVWMGWCEICQRHRKKAIVFFPKVDGGSQLRRRRNYTRISIVASSLVARISSSLCSFVRQSCMRILSTTGAARYSWRRRDRPAVQSRAGNIGDQRSKTGSYNCLLGSFSRYHRSLHRWDSELSELR